MDAELLTLGSQLAAVVARSTATQVAERIAVSKAKKQDQQTIAELEEIVNGLIADKSELVRIAQAFEQELVAQRIAPSDIEYISNNLVPILSQLVASSSPQPEQAKAVLDTLRPLLSVETVTVLQLVGFNFRKAIGEPLTELVAGLIAARGPGKASGNVVLPPRAGNRRAGSR
jgi:hypothetical protein